MLSRSASSSEYDAYFFSDEIFPEPLVNSPPKPIVRVLRRPQIIATTPGSSVCFEACFDVTPSSIQTYSFVWTVGKIKYIRSGNGFKVLNLNGSSVLILQEMKKEMSGLVTCQILTVSPNESTVLADAFSLCYVADGTFDESDIWNRQTLLRYLNWHEGTVKSENSRDAMKVWDCSYGVGPTTSSFQLESQLNNPGHTTFYIKVAWFGNRAYYMNAILNEERETTDLVQISMKNANHPPNTNVVDWLLLEWSAPNCHCKYIVDYYLPDNGKYIPMHATNKHHLYLAPPPLSTLIGLRIRSVPPQNVSAQLKFDRFPWRRTLPSIPSPYAVYCKVGTRSVPQNALDARFNDMYAFPKTNTHLVVKCGCNYNQFYQHYEDEILGDGATGCVFVLKNLSNGTMMAGKFVDIRSPRRRSESIVETNMLRRLDHPNIVPLLDVVSAWNYHITVVEYLSGGTLEEMLHESPMEYDVCHVIHQILQGLKYIHGLWIAHRDIKLQNIVRKHPNSLVVKIVDFGLAVQLEPNMVARGDVGTRFYQAPEVVSNHISTTAADMWAVGVVTYYLLSGKLPFYDSKLQWLNMKVIRGDYTFEREDFKQVSPQAIDFVKRLLVVRIDDRLTASQALQHPWMLEGRRGF